MLAKKVIDEDVGHLHAVKRRENEMSKNLIKDAKH